MKSVKLYISGFLLYVLTVGVVASVFINTAQAQPAYTINYQGKLTTPTGVAVTDGTYTMEFKLYTVSSGGVAVWTETRSGGNQVTVQNGLFSVMLGSVTSLTSVNFNQPLYLGVNIAGDGEMTPRKAIGSVPSAFEAKQLGGVASSSFLRSDQADVAGSLLTFNGGLISNSSSTLARLSFTNATGTSLFIGGDRITDFVGDGLQLLSGGTLQAALGSSVAANEIANGDHGFFSYASGVASLDTGGLTSANLSAALNDETGIGGGAVFSDSPTFTNGVFAGGRINLGVTGLQLTSDGDGAITFLGLGDGSDEDLTLNLDDTANTGVFTSSTGLNLLNFSGIGLQESGSNVLSVLDVDTSSELLTILTDETGTGNVVFSNSPTFTGTPVLPSSFTIGANTFARAGAFALTLTNTAATNVTFPTSGTLYGTAASSITSAELLSSLSNETGTGVAVFSTSPVLTTPNLGTPSALTLTNATGLPIVGGTTGTLTETRGGTNQTTYATGDLLYASGANTLAKRAIGTTGQVLSVVGGVPTWAATSTLGFLATAAVDTSAELRAILTDEVGTGAAYFVGGALGTPASVTLTNGTGLPISTGLTGAGTGVLTALGINVGTAGSFITNGGALGTPSSGVATNLTGTAAGLTAGTVTTNANLTGAITSTGNATALGSFTSANLSTALTDETGTGAAVFAGSPTFTGTITAAASTFSGGISVSGNTVSGAGLRLTDEGAYKQIQSYESEPLYINPLGNNTIFNTGGGSVGIGTTTPTSRLDVFSSSGVGFAVRRDGTFNSEGNNNVKLLDQTSLDVALQMGVDPVNNIGYIQAMQPSVSWTTRALVLQGNGGNVGIGDVTPSYKLEVEGTIRGDDIYAVRTAAPTTGVIYFGNNSGTRYLYYNGSAYALNGAELSINGGTAWHSANDGAGSGLDADLLDGISSASFLQGSSIDTSAELSSILTDETGTGAAVFAGSPTLTGTVNAAALSLSGLLSQSASGILIGLKDDLTTRTESGFYETSSGTTAEGWPVNDTSWQNIVSVTHSNAGNYYSLQIGGSIFDQNLYFRKTNNSGSTAWSKVISQTDIDASSELAAILTDETGTGAAVFAGSPTFTGTITSAAINATGISTFYASAAGNSSTAGGTTWLRAPKNAVTTFIGDNDNVSGYTANESSGNLRFNGAGVAWGDFGYYPTGGGAGNFGNFRLSLTGAAIDSTPDAKLGVGDLYVAGNVGIGNVSPTQKLDVDGVIRAGSANSTNGNVILLGKYSDGATNVLGAEYSSGGTVLGYGVKPSTSAYGSFLSSTGIALSRSAISLDSEVRFFTGGAQTVAIDGAVTNTEKMRLTNAGNLGVGTDSPEARLQVSPAAAYTAINSGQAFVIRNTGLTGANLAMGVSGTNGNTIQSRDGASTAYTLLLNPFGGDVNIGAAQTPRGTLSLGTDLTTAVERSIHFGWTGANHYGFRLLHEGNPGSFGAGKFHIQRGQTTAWANSLTIDDSGNVGIGTESPGRRLTVGGTATAYSSYAASSGRTFTTGTDSNGYIIFDDTAGAYRMTINSSGNVGIGDTSPDQKLSVIDTLAITNSGGAQFLLMGNQDSAGVNNPSMIVAANGNMEFGNGTSWTGSGGTFASRLMILDNGNVGVGTQNPNGRFEVTTNGGGDGVVFYQGVDNSSSIQSYIDAQWSNRASYASGCCNTLNINTDAGDIVMGSSGRTLTINAATTINSALTATGNITSGTAVYAAGASGFYSSTYVNNARNPIWRFGNADAFGVSYFQGTSGYTGGAVDTIGFHMGTASAAASILTINQDNTVGVNGDLRVAGAIKASDPSYSTRRYINVGQFAINGANQTGTIKIAMPAAKRGSDTMHIIRITGYDYVTGQGAWEVLIGGYSYSAGWINTSVDITGTPPFTSVRLGDDGSSDVILLGTTGTVWQYPQIFIDDYAGYSAQDGFDAAWTTSLITSESGITVESAPLIKTFATAAGNFGIGTVAPATTLDVRSATPIITVGTTGNAEGALYFGNSAHGVRRNYSATNDVGLYTTSGDVYLGSSGQATSQFVLKNSGSVGIGDATPDKLFDVEGGAVFGAGGINSGSIVDIGTTATDYPATSGWGGSFNANLTLHGQDTTSIGFHDGGISVGALSYTNNSFAFDGAGSWGPVSLGINDRTPDYTLDVGGTLGVDGASTFGGEITSAGNFTVNNGRKGLVGVYDASQTQAVFAMGSSYVLTNGGASNVYGAFYGMGWSYNPDYGGAGNNPQSKAGLNHQLLIMNNGVTQSAIGAGIWTQGMVTVATGNYLRLMRSDNAIYNEIYYGSGDKFQFNQANNGSYNFAFAGTDQLTIGNTGNFVFTAANPSITASSYVVMSGGAYFSSGTVYAEAAIQARGGINNDTGAYLNISGGTSNIIYMDSDTGIGRVDPQKRLDVYETSADSQFRVSYDGSNYADFRVDSAGDLILDSSGGDVSIVNDNLSVCSGGVCASTPTGQGMITAERSITAEEGGLASSGSITVNWDDGNQQRVSSVGNMTFTFSNATAGQTLRLVVCYGGAHTVTWGSTIRWAGGTAPTPTSANTKCDVFSFLYTGTEYFGQPSLNF